MELVRLTFYNFCVFFTLISDSHLFEEREGDTSPINSSELKFFLLVDSKIDKSFKNELFDFQIQFKCKSFHHIIT